MVTPGADQQMRVDGSGMDQDRTQTWRTVRTCSSIRSSSGGPG
ncbi:hypothetical protein ACFQV4_19400 [Streptomyces thermocarboxydus]